MTRYIHFAVVMLALGSLVMAPVSVQASDEHQNIVDTAVEAGSFTTLVAALQATGLDETSQFKNHNSGFKKVVLDHTRHVVVVQSSAAAN